MAKIKIDMRRATTPPSLFGIDRRMAYANRKYHSGWMCTGVTNGLAGLKFSGSPRRFGLRRVRVMSVVNRIKNPTRSLIVK